MEHSLREQLSELAKRLHLVADDERADALRTDVEGALDSDDHEGLSDRLEEGAVDFEGDHPDLASALRQVVEALGRSGI